MAQIDEALDRKNTPIFSGVVKYFPLALKAVARVSKMGNDQHNKGQPLHWAREKSTDHLDALVRHLIDYASGNKTDTDGQPHLAKVAWRALAQLELDEENKKDCGCSEELRIFCEEHIKEYISGK